MDELLGAFDVEGLPVPQGSLRPMMAGGRPVLIYTNREPLAVWRDAVRYACPITEPGTGAYRVTVTFRLMRPAYHHAKDGRVLGKYEHAHPTSRPDVDKLLRAVLDALTMRVWRDDAQVVAVTASKRWSSEPGATIVVSVCDG